MVTSLQVRLLPVSQMIRKLQDGNTVRLVVHAESYSLLQYQSRKKVAGLQFVCNLYWYRKFFILWLISYVSLLSQ